MMNITHMTKHPAVHHICSTTQARSSKIQQSGSENKTIDTLVTTIDVLKWLLRPESENEQPLFATRLANIWANTGKSLLWIGVAIGTGLLISRLSS